jgi:hypothetical protein
LFLPGKFELMPRTSPCQLARDRSLAPKRSRNPTRIRPAFQGLFQNDICEFKSSHPSQEVRVTISVQQKHGNQRINPRHRAMLLLTPDSFQHITAEITSVTYDLLSRTNAVLEATPISQVSFDAFTRELQEGFGRLDSWHKQVPRCIQTIFISGYAIREEWLASCKFEGELAKLTSNAR